jgi:hypothetical protein
MNVVNDTGMYFHGSAEMRSMKIDIIITRLIAARAALDGDTQFCRDLALNQIDGSISSLKILFGTPP